MQDISLAKWNTYVYFSHVFLNKNILLWFLLLIKSCFKIKIKIKILYYVIEIKYNGKRPTDQKNVVSLKIRTSERFTTFVVIDDFIVYYM